MKLTKISLSVILLILFIVTDLPAQTEFEGGIYNDMTWTKENSPYIITGNVVVFPDKILTVEPGVKITFTGDYYLEVRGKITMEGTKDDTIKINSNFLPTLENEWTGIIVDYPQAEFSFSYCSFDSLRYGILINELKKIPDTTAIAHCTFSNNVIGLRPYIYDGSIHIDSCYFFENLTGLGTGIGTQVIRITNSIFEANKVGMFEPWLIDIFNTDFYRNDTAILLGREGSVTDCIFEENYLAISSREWGLTMINNMIHNNNIGLRLIDYFRDMILPVEGNKICNNIIFNVENLDKYNKSLENNCWCTTDSSEIEAKLWDGYDDISVGLLNYDIYNELCDNKLKSVVKIELSNQGLGIDMIFTDDNLIEIFPIPTSNFLQIQIPYNKHVPGTLLLYTADGKLIFQKVIRERYELLDLSHLEKGMYIMNIRLNNDMPKSHIIIKE